MGEGVRSAPRAYVFHPHCDSSIFRDDTAVLAFPCRPLANGKSTKRTSFEQMKRTQREKCSQRQSFLRGTAPTTAAVMLRWAQPTSSAEAWNQKWTLLIATGLFPSSCPPNDIATTHLSMILQASTSSTFPLFWTTVCDWECPVDALQVGSESLATSSLPNGSRPRIRIKPPNKPSAEYFGICATYQGWLTRRGSLFSLPTSTVCKKSSKRDC